MPATLPAAHEPAARAALLWWLAAATFLFHVLTARGYGYFRDELYYLACGRHLALGYVDHPPLIAWVARAVEATLGTSLFALRLLPALAAGATAWLTGAIAAEVGGRRFAQALAALSVALAPVLVSLFTYFSMNAFDLLLWALAWWLFARILRAGAGTSTRTWLALGAVLGLALETKIGVLSLGLGLLVSLIVCRRWQLLRTRGPWLAAAVAVLLFLPHIAWQVQHGWPTLEFMHNARVHKMQDVAPLDWLVGQLMQMGLLAAPVWLAGLVWLFRPDARAFRPLAVTFLVVAAVMLLGQGKGYYTAPAYLPLFAAGGVAIERARRAPRLVRTVLPALLIAGGLLALPLNKPLLPVETFLRYQAALGITPGTGGERHERGRLPQFFADMHGWPELAATVARVYHALPAAEQRVACIFTEDYGQAGAVDVLGRAHGLPAAMAGHNNYWLWGGHACSSEVVIVIGGERAQLEPIFERVELAATFECERALCMPYENHKPIWVGHHTRVPLATLWPGLKHYD